MDPQQSRSSRETEAAAVDMLRGHTQLQSQDVSSFSCEPFSIEETTARNMNSTHSMPVSMHPFHHPQHRDDVGAAVAARASAAVTHAVPVALSASQLKKMNPPTTVRHMAGFYAVESWPPRSVSMQSACTVPTNARTMDVLTKANLFAASGWDAPRNSLMIRKSATLRATKRGIGT